MAAEEAEREAARLTAVKSTPSASISKPADELAELEDFFGKLNDDPYMDGLDISKDQTADGDMYRCNRRSGDITPSSFTALGNEKKGTLFSGDLDDHAIVSASDEYATLFPASHGGSQAQTMRTLTRENTTLRAEVM